MLHFTSLMHQMAIYICCRIVWLNELPDSSDLTAEQLLSQVSSLTLTGVSECPSVPLYWLCSFLVLHLLVNGHWSFVLPCMVLVFDSAFWMINELVRPGFLFRGQNCPNLSLNIETETKNLVVSFSRWTPRL